MVYAIVTIILYAILAVQIGYMLAMLGVYLYAPSTPHAWFDVVEESARREKESALRAFRFIGPASGGWRDITCTDTGANGQGYTYTSSDGSSGEWT
jgi:nicotinamide riboside transporter PnuC